jgi:tellurite resistance protein TerC
LSAAEQPLLAVFALVMTGFLVVDLAVLARRPRGPVTLRASLAWTALWAALSLAFAAAVWATLGRDRAVTFLTAYLVEQSLSVDNLFVFVLIFASFRVPPAQQRRVLVWGVIGAMALRGLCIYAGVAVLHRFEWLLYVFALVLVWGGFKTLLAREADDDDASPADGKVARLVRRVVPVTSQMHGERFFVRESGRLVATPLFLALVVVEVSDLVFAVDSIPAVLAISQDAFVVYTSNVFAIMGLRSIYFAVAELMRLFRYMKYALALILIFVGAEIGLARVVRIPTTVTLAVVVALLASAAAASAWRRAPAT